MTASAYHLFKELYQRRRSLTSPTLAAEDFMLSDDLVSFTNSQGQFPDIILKTNQDDSLFQGGEFVEVKDATSGYIIASFNSTIPSGVKRTRDHITRNGELYKQLMENESRDPYLLETREVYYLIRGRKNPNWKVCLVHGDFFETLSAVENIRSALKDAVQSAMQDSNLTNDPETRRAAENMLNLDWRREHFSSVKHNEKASVSIRMRVMADIIKEANVLNARQYPAIGDNTFNMIVPAHPEKNYATLQQQAIQKMQVAFGGNALPNDLRVSKLMHLRNGPFVLFQADI